MNTVQSVLLSLLCGGMVLGCPRTTAVVSEPNRAGPPKDVGIVATLVTPTVKLGEPILLNVALHNWSDDKCVLPDIVHPSISILDANGTKLTWVGGPYQIAHGEFTMEPREIYSIYESLDLTSRYLFKQPGKYTILCGSRIGSVKASDPVALNVTPGGVPAVDACLIRLMERCPDDWWICKASQRTSPTIPIGWRAVPGDVIYILWSSGGGVDNRIQIWLTKEQSKMDRAYVPEHGARYIPRGEYWGVTEFGHVYVHIDLDSLHKAEDADRRMPRKALPPHRDEVVATLRWMLGLDADPAAEPASHSDDGGVGFPIIALSRNTAEPRAVDYVMLRLPYGLIVSNGDVSKPASYYLFCRDAQRIVHTQHVDTFLEAIEKIPDKSDIDMIEKCTVPFYTQYGVDIRYQHKQIMDLLKRKQCTLHETHDGGRRVSFCYCEAGYRILDETEARQIALHVAAAKS